MSIVTRGLGEDTLIVRGFNGALAIGKIIISFGHKIFHMIFNAV